MSYKDQPPAGPEVAFPAWRERQSDIDGWNIYVNPGRNPMEYCDACGARSDYYYTKGKTKPFDEVSDSTYYEACRGCLLLALDDLAQLVREACDSEA